MKVLVLGATGATGRHVVHQLLKQHHQVTALVRNTETQTALLKTDPSNLTQILGTALTLNDVELAELIEEADCVVSCLGHNLTLKGMFGAPRMLVRDSIQRIVKLTNSSRPKPLKLVLMSSSGVINTDQAETVSLAQHAVLGLLRLLVPPHLDNERAAKYLRTQCKDQSYIQWVSVRPDSLIDDDQVTEYTLHPSPMRSAIFNAGKVSRINVANVMTRLISDKDLWVQWKGAMPVVYNAE